MVGRANLAESEDHTLDALAALLAAVPGARVLPVLRRGNVRGAIAAGLTPGEGGLDTPGIMAAAAEGKVRCLVLLGADPLSDLPDGELADKALDGAATVIAVDTHLTPSSRRAHLVLPAAAPGEKAGTTTNLEGRVTALSQKVTPPGSARPDWVIATDLATAMGAEVDTASVEELHELLAATVPAFAPATGAALAADRDGVLLAPETPRSLVAVDGPAPAPRSSYDLRLLVSRSLYDAGITVASSPSLAPLAPGERLHVHPLDLDRLGATTGTSLKVSSSHASLTMEVEADAAVSRGVAWLPFNQPGVGRGPAARRRRRRDRRPPGEPVMTLGLLAQATSGGDPLYAGDIDLAVVLITVLKVVVCFVFLLVATMLMVWFERKVIAGMQNRVGPNKAGPFGVLQTLADGIKAFFKERINPERADPFVYRLAPYLAFVPAFLIFTVVPVGGSFADGNDGVVTIFGHETFLQVADPPVGILFVLALSSIAVYGIMLAGWSSGSKYPLLGSVRASAQMVSYEAALGLSVATVLLVAGTLSTNGIVVEQDTMRDWNIVTTGLLPFVVFVIAATAELNRPPFDLVEAEQELVGGFHTEYSRSASRSSTWPSS